MAIKRPDIYEHNNPNLPIVDSDFVKGGIRSAVQNISDLYTLTGKSSQLKQYSTQVYVSGENKFYLLKDINNIGNITGWEEATFHKNNLVYTTGNQTISGIKNFSSRPTFNQIGLATTGDLIGLEFEVSGLIEILDNGIVYTTGNQTISGIKNFISRPTVNGTGILLSGEAAQVDLSNYATVANLAATGSTLQSRINSLSGAAIQSNGTITRMIRLTQAQYNALSPKDPTTFYVIVD